MICHAATKSTVKLGGDCRGLVPLMPALLAESAVTVSYFPGELILPTPKPPGKQSLSLHVLSPDIR